MVMASAIARPSASPRHHPEIKGESYRLKEELKAGSV